MNAGNCNRPLHWIRAWIWHASGFPVEVAWQSNGAAALFDFGQCRWCLETRGVKAMTDGSHLDDPEYWRDRAAQVRALADGISNEKARAAILQIAADYAHLAERAEERASHRR